MKKVLMVATYGDFFAAFETNNIKILNDLNYEVHLCANWEDPKYNYKFDRLKNLEFTKINIPFERSPFSKKNIFCYKELLRLMNGEKYELIDCHNAVVGFYSRIAAKKSKINKIMYTAHGFQFFRDGSIIDWIIYYPIEKILSSITDQLVVINNEDFNLAKKKFKSKKIDKIPGVGFDYSNFSKNKVNIPDKKNELGLPADSFVIISVGELSKRKNHKIIIEALSKINNKNIYYIIAGQGDQYKYLKDLAQKNNIEENIKLLGHRSDITELNAISNIAAFPSRREGLGIAALESLAAGLPLISSNIQGIKDYSINGITGITCDPSNVDAFSTAILNLYNDKALVDTLSINGRKKAKEFSIYQVNSAMIKIYTKNLC